ncbi:hypothetical protein BC962_0481 [Gillisia mitskevichiae]|uniref:DUF5017 domain-containing protein n=1 Tax=Gillisia mitskevichiae TaxID=270921 RepID=A0A495PXF1_9FLAO|nr:hypothetical protein [Gillisia mitskevichiae]RKS55518.1 hypothetical protein BC962_0481 [Gillisia mitskevichiae]
MKNTFYYLAIFLGLALTSCEPMEDIHDDINSKLENERAVGDIVYTLTEDDYDDLGLNFPNFNSVDDAKSLLPAFLEDNYPNYGAKSSAKLTFDIYAPQSTEKFLKVYTVTTEDYDAYPETEEYNNFDDNSQIYAFLNDKFPDLENRTLVSLTYKFYDGSLKTLNNGFLYVNDEFQFIPGLTDDEYELVGEGFPNFSTEDEADVKLPLLLKEKYKFEILEAGDIKSIMYKLYTTDVQDVDGDGSITDRATYSYVKYFIYDGAKFSPYNNTLSQSIQFGNIDGVWIPDNTIRYTLAGSDYSLVGSEFLATYPGPADNVGNFSSFDVRESSSNLWKPEMLIEAMNVVLDNLMPNAEEGQQYVVTFDVYNGSVVSQELSLIKTNGVWVINE